MNMSKTHRSAAAVEQLEALLPQIEKTATDDFIELCVNYVNEELPKGEQPTNDHIKEAIDRGQDWIMNEALGNLTESASGTHSATRMVDGIRARKFAEIIREISRTGYHGDIWVKLIQSRVEANMKEELK